MKESLCYVSSDFMTELQAARPASKVTRAMTASSSSSASRPAAAGPSTDTSTGTCSSSGGGSSSGPDRRAPARDHMGGALKKQFVLPDYHHVMKGFVKPDDEAVDPKEQVNTFGVSGLVLSTSLLL